MHTQSHHFLLCDADLGWGASSSQGMFPLLSHFEHLYYNKGSSFLWNQEMLVMMPEGKHILTSMLCEDKVDIFLENARKRILKTPPLKFLSESFLHCIPWIILGKGQSSKKII